MANYPEWRVIEQQIDTLEKTGSWPNQESPRWAKEVADELRCSTGGSVVIDAGLREIIRQLKAGGGQ